jgi:hypothetical protein
MAKFRTLPVEIDAVHLDMTLIFDCLFGGKELPMGVEFRGEVNPTERHYMGTFVCHSRQGDVTASPDDWIIQEPGAPALCYPCKPDVFEAKYELADSPDDVKGTPTPTGQVFTDG